MILMTFENIIASLAKELGLDMSAEDGTASFRVQTESGRQVEVSIFTMDDGESVELCAELGEVPSEGAGDLMLRMLEANHLFSSTGGATLSVDEGHIKLERYAGIVEFERGDGTKIASRFLDTAKMWADIVAC